MTAFTQVEWRVRVVQVIGVLAITSYVAVLMWAMTNSTYNEWGALVVIPVIIVLTVPMLIRAGRSDDDPLFLQMLVAAFVLKALATFARYQMAFVWYGGATDAGSYHKEGARLAEFYRAGIFDADIGREFIGTGFIRVFTGAIYTVTGPSVYVAFAVYALFSFWGLYFLYRAFQVGVPTGDTRRYAVLVLFLPSMLFWPSALGKEALMTFGLGLAALGAARLLMGHRRWLLPLAVGLATTTLVRPHITAAFFTALAVAFLVRKPVRPSTELTPVIRVFGLGLVLVGFFVIVSRAAQFLDIDTVSVASVDSAIQDSAGRTTQGGSEFTSVAVRSPADLPLATISVLFRPFLFEASSVQLLIAALEGTVLLGLAAMSIKSFRHIPSRLRRQPYLVLCATYTLMFVYAFSSFSNFGILTRQRVTVLPFALVFLALAGKEYVSHRNAAQPRREEVLS
jgi:hypothetical protein